MPLTGGTLNHSQIEAAARKRTKLQADLRSMEERYARYLRARQGHIPDARYLKKCMDDLKQQLGGR